MWRPDRGLVCSRRAGHWTRPCGEYNPPPGFPKGGRLEGERKFGRECSLPDRFRCLSTAEMIGEPLAGYAEARRQ